MGRKKTKKEPRHQVICDKDGRREGKDAVPAHSPWPCRLRSRPSSQLLQPSVEAGRLLLLTSALKKQHPMPKPPWISPTNKKKGLRAIKQLNRAACARSKDGKAGKTGRKGVVGDATALLAGPVICGVTLDVSFIPLS